VALAARQFFQFAQFDPSQPEADEPTYRKLIQRVLARNPRQWSPSDERVRIPGYENLRQFSAAHERLLKTECGGAWESYFQRGHWRMILPLSPSHQEQMAAQLLDNMRRNLPPIVHVVRFPQLSINHALLLIDATESDTSIRFAAYDPNNPDRPVTLTFNRQNRRFCYPRTDYFRGGRVDVYQIFHAWDY
jgi:hypothetical protein